jgi:hypothetical protein
LVNERCVGLREEHVGKLLPVGRQVFLQCAESCERALRQYTNEVGMARGHHPLFVCLLRAIATVRTAVDLMVGEDSRLELALRLTVDACRAAAARSRQAGFDASLLRCAVACDRAADEAEFMLTSFAH